MRGSVSLEDALVVEVAITAELVDEVCSSDGKVSEIQVGSKRRW